MKNTLEILGGDTVSQSENTLERIIIYGRAGIGKTRLALSLPEEKYGEIVYYAADTNSWQLSSISKSKRSRIHVVKPRGDDPTSLFMQFCMTDWKEMFPNAKTLVVDTYTKVALDSIAFSANTNAVDREPHYIIGTPGEGGVAIPNRGDYQAIDSLSKGYLDMIFSHQEGMHIIFICHEDVKIVEGVSSIGGPAHPGRTMTEYLPAQFSTVIRLTKDQQLNDDTGDLDNVVVATTENDGKYIAKLRSNDESQRSPLAVRTLDLNPSSYWIEYDNSLEDDNEPVAPKKKKKKKDVSLTEENE